MKLKIVVITIIFTVLFIGCSQDSDKDKSIQNSNTHKSNIEPVQSKKSIQVLVKKEKVVENLQDKLNNLLKHNGKVCTPPSSNLYIKSSSWSTDSSSKTSKVYKHTNVISNGGGSYSTYDTTTGGDTTTTIHGINVKVKIENGTDKTVDVYLSISANTHRYYSNWWSSGYAEAKEIDGFESISVPAEGYSNTFYYQTDGTPKDEVDVSIVAKDNYDDISFNQASTIEGYVRYLQQDGCHYHLSAAKSKIRQLFNEKIYKEALAHKKPEKRILALEKYLEVFTNPLAKKVLNRNKRMIALLQITKGYDSIIWEKDNPLLYSFDSPEIKHDEKTLYVFIYNYMKASEEKYKKEAYIEEKSIDKEPLLENFGIKPNKESYPAKPVFQKGEFEKEKEFILRKKEELSKWNAKKSVIDKNYEDAMTKYKQNQKKQYSEAHDVWLQKKQETEQENIQAKQEYKKKLNSMKEYEEQWLWQAVVTAIGKKDFTFTTLKYDSEKEQFDYVLEGGVLNFKFEGTINVPIEQAKAFKESLSKSLSIIFKIKNDRLYIEDFMPMDEPSSYKVNCKTKLILADNKQLKKLLELRKAGIYLSSRFMWQDNNDAKKIKRNWKGAKTYCKKLVLGGHSDWYLPTKQQLASLYKNTATLKNIASYNYWSSSEYVLDSSEAWHVYFSNGFTHSYRKSYDFSVRCVRGIQ